MMGNGRQDERNWLKVAFSCPEEVAEAAIDLIGVLSNSGVEQTPPQQGVTTVSGFFHLEPDAPQGETLDCIEQELGELFALYSLPAPALSTSLLADQDWATSWQQFFTPFAIAPGLVIKPSWEDYAPAPGEQLIELDPGMAFGTGQHASTKLALGLIHACCQEAQEVAEALDIGTGTGILAMGAARLGAHRVIAIDNDPEAVQTAAKNIAHNGLQDTIVVSGVDVAHLSGSFDLICANIIHDVLVDMAPVIRRLLADNGRLVLAGILQGAQEENIVRVYSALRLRKEQAVYEDEWCALLLRAT